MHTGWAGQLRRDEVEGRNIPPSPPEFIAPSFYWEYNTLMPEKNPSAPNEALSDDLKKSKEAMDKVSSRVALFIAFDGEILGEDRDTVQNSFRKMAKFIEDTVADEKAFKDVFGKRLKMIAMEDAVVAKDVSIELLYELADGAPPSSIDGADEMMAITQSVIAAVRDHTIDKNLGI